MLMSAVLKTFVLPEVLLLTCSLSPPEIGLTQRVPDQLDAAITRVIVGHDGAVVGMFNGTGQSCYDGWLTYSSPAAVANPVVWHFGPSQMSQLQCESPELIAMVSDRQVVLNAICSTGGPPDGATGNVLLVDISTGDIRPLTYMGRSFNMTYRAITWCEEEGVIVAVRSKIGVSNNPTAILGTEVGVFVTLAGKEYAQGDKFPMSAAVLRSWCGIELRGLISDQHEGWCISSEHGKVDLWQTAIGGVPPAVYMLDARGKYCLATSPGEGSWLIDLINCRKSRVSDLRTLSIDMKGDAWVLIDDTTRSIVSRVAGSLTEFGLADVPVQDRCSAVAPVRIRRDEMAKP